MNLKEIKEIVKLMNANDLGEVEVEREGSKLVLKKGSSAAACVPVAAPAPVAPAVAAAPAPSAAPAAETAKPAVSGNQVEITSPMVGTFYRAPSPESPPFVELGQIVDVGQVVCIVEAMKLMNEIKSEVKGKIIDVVGINGEPVEFGQPLFIVEPM